MARDSGRFHTIIKDEMALSGNISLTDLINQLEAGYLDVNYDIEKDYGRFRWRIGCRNYA